MLSEDSLSYSLIREIGPILRGLPRGVASLQIVY
jgi:hypothetical protein